MSNENDTRDNLPEGDLIIEILKETNVALFGLCLFDSGSTSTLINEPAIPFHGKGKQESIQKITAAQGNYLLTEYFYAAKLCFSNFVSQGIFHECISAVSVAICHGTTLSYVVHLKT